MRRAWLCLFAVVCASTSAAGTEVNIAPSATVTVVTGVTWGAPIYSLVDAHWSDPWEQGICWNDRSTVIRIDLPMAFTATTLFLQGHEDDSFQIDYLYQGSWTPLWEVENTAAGLRTLPTAAQTVRWTILAVPAVEAFRIYASANEPYTSGELYSLTEFQAWGRAVLPEVPEPPDLWTALAGLALFAGGLRLRAEKT